MDDLHAMTLQNDFNVNFHELTQSMRENLKEFSRRIKSCSSFYAFLLVRLYSFGPPTASYCSLLFFLSSFFFVSSDIFFFKSILTRGQNTRLLVASADMGYFGVLPAEIVLHIFSYFSARDLCRAARGLLLVSIASLHRQSIVYFNRDISLSIADLLSLSVMARAGR